MTIIWNSGNLKLALEVMIPENILITGKVEFNSKNVQNGDIFIALNEGIGDGHDYVADAISKGALIAIVSKNIKNIDNNQLIYVDNTYEALLKLAKYKRKISNAKFIAITGSIGKTTTKEIINSLLKPYYKIFATRANFNNHIGVPLNIASLQDDLDYVILELGMSSPGEISNLSKITKPDIAIITNVEAVHLKYFNDIIGILDAKCEIVDGMNKDGIVLINFDSDYYDIMVSRLNSNFLKDNLSHLKIYNFGVKVGSNYRLISRNRIDENRWKLEYYINNKLITINSKHIQEHLTIGFIVGLAISDIIGINIDYQAKILSDFSPIFGRGQIVNARFNKKNVQIICDHYNSSPKAMILALKYLKEFQHEHKMVIIADMLELGDMTVKLHMGLVPYILDIELKSIILIGENCKHIYDTLPDNILKLYFNNVTELINQIDRFIFGGELILLKGSNSMNLNKILDVLTLE